MDCFDHYPWSALIADITAQLTSAPLPGSTPARDPIVAPALPPANRFRLRYGVMECMACGYAQAFCNCAKRAAPDAPSGDARAESDLSRRIKACQGGR